MQAIRHPSFWLVVVAALGLSAVAYFGLLLQQNPFHSDEAQHALKASVVAQYLRDLNFRDLLAFSARETYYPFFARWVYGLSTALFGISDTVARATTLALAFVSVVVTYLFASSLSGRRKWVIGLTASALLLASPQHWIMSVQVMLEPLWLLLLLLNLWAYIQTVKRDSLRYAAITGVLLLLNFLTRYGHGMLLGAGAGVLFVSTLVYRDFGHSRWRTLKLHIVMFGVPALMALLWLLIPPDVADSKLRLSFSYYTRYIPHQEFEVLRGTNSLTLADKLLFYPRSLLTYNVLSPWIGVLLILGFLAAFRFFRVFQVRAVLLWFLVPYVLLTVASDNLRPRYFYPLTPLLFILGGFWVERLLPTEFRFRRLSLFLMGLVMLAGVGVLGDAYSLLRSLKPMANYSNVAFSYNADSTRWAPPLLFGLVPRPDFTLPLFPPENSMNSKARYPPSDTQETTLSVLRFIEENTSSEGKRCILGQWHEISNDLVQWYFRGQPYVYVFPNVETTPPFRGTCTDIVTFQVAETSPFYYGQFVAVAQWDIKRDAQQMAEDPRYLLKTSKDFNDLGMTVRIYEKLP